jgi:hypothetical protein
MSTKHLFQILVFPITEVASVIVVLFKKLSLGLLANDPDSAKFRQVAGWIAVAITVAVLLVFGIVNN